MGLSMVMLRAILPEVLLPPFLRLIFPPAFARNSAFLDFFSLLDKFLQSVPVHVKVEDRVTAQVVQRNLMNLY